MSKKMVTIIGVIAIFALAIGLAALEAYVIMLLANWIFAQVAINVHLSFWVTWGIIILCNMLFKSHSTTRHNS